VRHDASAIPGDVLGPSEVDPAAMAEIREAWEVLPTPRTLDVVDLASAAADVRRAAVAEGLEVRPA